MSESLGDEIWLLVVFIAITVLASSWILVPIFRPSDFRPWGLLVWYGGPIALGIYYLCVS